MRKMLLGTLAAGSLVLAGCGASDPFDESAETEGEGVVVGSANFAESVLLGEIYSQALENAGFEVTQKPNIGSREVLYQQMESCEIDVTPEYNGALLSFIDSENEANTTETVDEELAKVLPEELAVLKSSDAVDKNALTVKQETADDLGLETLEDLESHAPDMIVGGPPEWEPRPDGLVGLKEHYGIEFKEFKSLGDVSGPISVSALNEGDVDTVMMQTSSPQLDEHDFVALEDPLNVMGINNIIPLICEESVDPDVQDVLNHVSETMTTDQLVQMNRQYSIDKDDAAAVASRWLDEHLS